MRRTAPLIWYLKCYTVRLNIWKGRFVCSSHGGIATSNAREVCLFTPRLLTYFEGSLANAFLTSA
jgi:hypothetical protein